MLYKYYEKSYDYITIALNYVCKTSKNVV